MGKKAAKKSATSKGTVKKKGAAKKKGAVSKKAAVKKKGTGKKKGTSRTTGVSSAQKNGAPDPLEWYTISDAEQLKLITNDLRAKILIEFAKEELTPKQVADRLGEPPTKLYRHVAALAKHGLIVATREEKKRGTIQQFYRAIATNFRIDDNCFPDDQAAEDSKLGIVFKMLNSISGELTSASQESGERYVAAVSSFFHASESEVEEIGEKIFDAIARIGAEHIPRHKPRKSDREYRFTMLVHPASQPPAGKKKPRKKQKKQK